MNIIRKLIENAKQGHRISEIEEKKMRGEETTEEERRILDGKEVVKKQVLEEEKIEERGLDVRKERQETEEIVIPEEEKYCINCSEKLIPGARFCVKCGKEQ